MSSLGRLATSLLSATNENTLALASLNFDFSLIKFEAPKEFAALGETLSLQRRNEAEDGAIHKTARRLGALFEQIIPPTPQLIKAYGLRVSDIVKTPEINPKGSNRDGPFEAFVGADGTSIWAAATSDRATSATHAPLAVHLLACMLVRAWDAQVATSIWAEIVEERRKEIESSVNDGEPLLGLCMAARQKISRKSLASWDASARSWLRSADDAKTSEQTRLMLILKNINIPVSGGTSTYTKVIEAWKQAMIGMEKLISGMPQQISDGAILLALSAWHLFPDLIVLGKQTVSVKFKDTLIGPGGVITVGLQPTNAEMDPGMQWSLALSHLRHYGDAVKVDTDHGYTRVTMNQLLLVAFGRVLSEFGFDQTAATEVASWLRSIWEYLEGQGTEYIHVYPVHELSWFCILVKAATYTLECLDKDFETCSMLLKWGSRRAKAWFEDEMSKSSPLLRLCNPSVLEALSEQGPIEKGIRYFRDVAQQLGLDSGDAVICYRELRNYTWCCEYATAVPHMKVSQKRSEDGSMKSEKVHSRWLVMCSVREQVPAYQSCSCPNTCLGGRCPCSSRGGGCNSGCHRFESRKCNAYAFSFDERIAQVTARSEQCRCIHNRDMFSTSSENLPKIRQEGMVEIQAPGELLMWDHPPPVFHNHNDMTQKPDECPSLAGAAWPCRCFDRCERPAAVIHQARFQLLRGSTYGIGLFARIKEGSVNEDDSVINRMKSVESKFMRPGESSKRLTDGSIDRHSIISYLQCMTAPSLSEDAFTDSLSAIVGQQVVTETYRRTLEALAIASHVYESLPGATVPLKIARMKLFSSKWLPSEMLSIHNLSVNQHRVRSNDAKNQSGTSFDDYRTSGKGWFQFQETIPPLDRSEIFACIAMFESGCHDIEPVGLSSVMAMSSGNSIFVAPQLLSDPYDYDKGRVQRITGNVGRPGITMMVAPQQLRRRELSDNYRVVAHAEYDGKRQDCFQGTSLHLSFTDWKLPLATESRGSIDEAVFCVESVISVHDRGEWVADLDPLTVGQMHDLTCTCSSSTGETPSESFTSVDSWEELLDPPDNFGIFRAHGNWAARLAAVAMLGDHSFGLVDPDRNLCFKCIKLGSLSWGADPIIVID